MQNARRPLKPARKPPPVPQVEEHITNVPVPEIKELNKALKSHAKSYRIELQDNLNPLTLFQLGGGGRNPPLSRFFPRHRHKNQPIDSNLSVF